ncbi:MAG TPA: sulfatase-like hydrolase/transferase [Candidatus Polarisedimenticolia bacterium]|jgi:arylsulfatase A-like enzyme
MSRTVALALAFALLLAAGLWTWTRLRPLPVPRNVLLITLDTLRADRVGCTGSTKGLTPNLDALAADGVCFINAYSTVPLTAPSHATMLTGRYPLSHGLRNNGTQVLSPEEILLSEILHERGFQTAAIVSSLVLSSEFGLNQGFDLYYEDGIKGSEGRHGLWFDQRVGDKTVDRALLWMKAEGDRPFFLWVHLYDPHAPYEPPSPWKEKYAKTPYDGEVAFTDVQVGRLLDELRSMGLYDRTLIAVSGDHGEGLGDHQELYHAIFLYDATTHVPLIFRIPGAGRGRRVSDLASTLDISPTILEALKIPAPTGRHAPQGVSLLSAAAGRGRVPARALYLESIYPTASYGWATTKAFIRAPWKFIDLPEPELYEMTNDPREKTNLNASEPARVYELRSEYDVLTAEIEAVKGEAETAAIDDETRDRLMSLGYIGGQQSETISRVGPDPKRMASLLVPLSDASLLMRTKKYPEAESAYQKVLETDPDNRIGLIALGRALVDQGKLDEAGPYFRRAIATYPDVEEFYRVFGWTYLRARRFGEAEEVFKKALAALPQSAHMHFLLGYTRFLIGKWSGAEEELELAVRLNKRLGKPHYLIAICRLRAKDESGALASLEEYLKRDRDIESLFRDPFFDELRKRPAFQDLIKKYL